jgi:hypothetical protein
MNLILMHYSNPVAWLYMPQLIARVRKFSEDMNLDLNPDLMEEMVRVNFVAQTPQVLALASVEESKMVGHLVASIDTLSNYRGEKVKRYLTILQAEHDKDNPMSPEYRKQALGVCQEWAKSYYCDAIQILCEEEWRVRLFRDRYGFKVSKTIMHMEVT